MPAFAEDLGRLGANSRDGIPEQVLHAGEHDGVPAGHLGEAQIPWSRAKRLVAWWAAADSASVAPAAATAPRPDAHIGVGEERNEFAGFLGSPITANRRRVSATTGESVASGTCIR